MERQRGLERKQETINRFTNAYCGGPDARLPVCALTALMNADVFEYVGEECRVKPKELSREEQDRLIKFDSAYESGESGGIGRLDDSVLDAQGRVQLLPVGKPSKKDKQILFTLLCIAPQKETQEKKNEVRDVREVRGPYCSIQATDENRVFLSGRACAALANFLYGRGAQKSYKLFIDDLKKLSHREFHIQFRVGRQTLKYCLIPFSIATAEIVSDEDRVRIPAGVEITFSDIFFYESRLKYGIFNIGDMFRGLMSKEGIVFANLVSYLARFLPAATMQMKKGKSYNVSVPIEKILPGYDASLKQNKLRTRNSIKTVGGNVSHVLLGHELKVASDKVFFWWAPSVKEQDK